MESTQQSRGRTGSIWHDHIVHYFNVCRTMLHRTQWTILSNLPPQRRSLQESNHPELFPNGGCLHTLRYDTEKRQVWMKKMTDRVLHCMQHPARQWLRIVIVLSTLCIVLFYDLNIWMIQRSMHHNNNNNRNVVDHSPSSRSSEQSPVFGRRTRRRYQHAPIIDIISIGSLLKQPYQLAQQRTFANTTISPRGRWSTSNTGRSNFRKVRHYYGITETDDTDTTCFTSLTSQQFHDIVQFCHDGSSTRNHRNPSAITHRLVQDGFQPKKHTGFMCAQKRMIDGLYKVLLPSKRQPNRIKSAAADSTPDYLFILEDDTYINLDRMLPELPMQYPSSVPYAITGSSCTITDTTISHSHNNTSSTTLTLPQIGYGIILTKASLQRLLQPIYYDPPKQQQPNPFSKLVQFQLLQNQMGEMHYFTNGMSLLELMYTWASRNLYTDIDIWKENDNYHRNHQDSLYTKNRNTGYCLTSDTALAYFIHYYFITVPDDQLEILSTLLTSHNNTATTPNAVDFKTLDTIRRQTDTFVHLAGTNVTSQSTEQCSTQHLPENKDRSSESSCTVHDRICHNVKPEQMDQLHHQYYYQNPESTQL
jgi:hypothetical protein